MAGPEKLSLPWLPGQMWPEETHVEDFLQRLHSVWGNAQLPET